MRIAGQFNIQIINKMGNTTDAHPVLSCLRLEILQEKYSVNECFVAQQPIKIEVIKTKLFEGMVCVAEYKGVWAYGYNYYFRYGAYPGGGCLPSFNEDGSMDKSHSDTQEGAVKKGLLRLLEIVESRSPGQAVNYDKDGEAISKQKEISKQPFIDAINDLLHPKPKQLSLF